MKTAKYLGVIIVLQVLILAGQWVGPTFSSRAMADLPDPGSQRTETIDQLKSVNEKLDKLMDYLQSGDLQVRVKAPDEKGN
jgi:hypothetical protein